MFATTSRRRFMGLFIVVLASVCLTGATARAAAGTWNQAAAGTYYWTNSANWVSGTIPNGGGDAASVTADLTGAQTNSVGTAAVTVGSISLGDSGSAYYSYTLANGTGGSLILTNTPAGTGVLISKSGPASDLISAPITLRDHLILTNDQNDLAQSLRLSGIISGGKNVTLAGAGANSTFELSGANTFTGALTLSSGWLRANTVNSALGAGTLTLNGGTLDFNNSALLAFSRNTTVGGSASIISEKNAAGAGVTYTLGTLAIGSSTLTVGGGNVSSGVAGLTFGATTLSGSPTFAINNPAAGGTTLLTLGAIANGTNTVTLTGNGNFAQAGVWGNGSGGLTMDAAFTGTNTLGQANTFTGPVTIHNGILVLVNAAGLGPAASAAVQFGAATTNGRLRSNGYSITLMSLNSDSTNAIVENGASASSTSLTVNNALSNTFAGIIQNGGVSTLSFFKGGAGTLTLSGTNSYTGATTVNAGGALNVQSGTALGATNTGTTVASGGALQVQGGIAIGNEPLTVIGTGVSASGALRNIAGDNSYAGLVTLGATGVRINSDAGSLTLDVASGNAITGAAYNVTFGGAGAITVADPIAITTGALVKDGAGTLTLSATNTFTGATTVSNGTLIITRPLAAGLVTVWSNAALGGIGTCTGAVAVRAGGLVAPGLDGSAGGALTIGRLALSNGCAAAFEFSAAPSNDTVVVTNTLTLDPGVGVYLYAQGTTNAWTAPGLFNLIQYSGTLIGSAANLTVLNPQAGKTYNFVATNGWISLRADLPEVAVLPASNYTTNGARMNGLVVNGSGAENPSVYFCWDTSDKGTAATSAWAHVDYVGAEWGTGQAFSNDVTGLLSGSNYTYRCYATNSTGSGWSPTAARFRPVYLPTVANNGAVVTGPGAATLRGTVTDTGNEAPNVWFLYGLAGSSETTTVDVGSQTGACSTAITGLLSGSNYVCILTASNSAGATWSAPVTFHEGFLVNTYIGTNNGAWEVAANWSLGLVPAAGDAMILPGGKTVTLDTAGEVGSLQIGTNAILSVGGVTGTNTALTVHWRAPKDPARTDPVGLVVYGDATIAGNLAIGGLNQSNTSFLTVNGNLTLSNNLSAAFPAQLAIYAGPTNAATTYQTGGARVTVSGMTILAGASSWIYPYSHQITGAPVVFDLQDLMVASTAGFNATGRGYGLVGSTYYGPGVPATTTSGGSYGGLGANAAANTIYGFRFAPYLPGSPGRNSRTDSRGWGGGAIRILARTITLQGKLIADGSNNDALPYGAGSGGSVWITCSNLTAGTAASMSVKGGTATQQSSSAGGGGGRIAIMTDMPTGSQLNSLYATGTCDGLIVVTTNMLDSVTSPYPALANVAGGLNTDNWYVQPYVSHGKAGTAVWLRNKGDDYQITVSGSPSTTSTVQNSTIPAYGAGRIPPGEFLFSAISPGFVYGSSARSRLSCTGYAWSNALASGSGAETNFTLVVTNDTWVTWSWSGLEHNLSVRSGGKGSVVADYSDWYSDGSTVTLTAQPEGGCSFLYWIGDLPYADRANASLTLTMNQPRAVMACFTAPPAGARSLVWAGGNSTNDWFNPANWDNVAIPGVYDAVTITNGTNLIVIPAELTVGSLTLARTARLFIGGTGPDAATLAPVSAVDARPYSLTVTGNLVMTNGAQAGLGGLNPTSRVDLIVGGNLVMSNSASLVVYASYKGPTTDVATYQVGGAGVTVGGSTFLGTNCWIIPQCHQVSGAPVIFNLQDLTIATNAGFNADARGFGRLTFVSAIGNWTFANYGPGRVPTLTARFTNKSGGSYGGMGGGTLAVGVYGYTNAPFWPGSPDFDDTIDIYTLYAGGAIRIQARQVQLNGQLKANSYPGRYAQGSCSGGGIWVTCSGFSVGPGALMSAAGGSVYAYGNNSGGGGGRIAVALKLSSQQIADLYASGTAKGLLIQAMSNSPYASNYSVAGGGRSGTGSFGSPGSAVFVIGQKTGTIIMVR